MNKPKEFTMHEYMAYQLMKLMESIDFSDESDVRVNRKALGRVLTAAQDEWCRAVMGIKNEKEITQFVSCEAQKLKDALPKSKWNGKFVREHKVPKQEYIIDECIELHMNGFLTEDRIVEILDDYWATCLVTKAEDKLLNKKFRTTMPPKWRGNIDARYRATGVKYRKNKEFMKLYEKIS